MMMKRARERVRGESRVDELLSVIDNKKREFCYCLSVIDNKHEGGLLSQQ